MLGGVQIVNVIHDTHVERKVSVLDAAGIIGARINVLIVKRHLYETYNNSKFICATIKLFESDDQSLRHCHSTQYSTCPASPEVNRNELSIG